MEGNKGKVLEAQGNLITIEFEGDILQNEVVYVKTGGQSLKGEVIEVNGNKARIQIFEITKGVKFNDTVELTHDLLVAELGPGLLTMTFRWSTKPSSQFSREK
jgi:V/A-type H+-transporting ATPase subunit A